MKQRIVKKEHWLTERKSMKGTLACGHVQSVKRNQKFATCKRCEYIAYHRARYEKAQREKG